MINLLEDVKFTKGVGPTRVKLLNKLNIFTLEDLITYFPKRYEDRGIFTKIQNLVDGEEVSIQAVCISKMYEITVRKNMTMYKLKVKDETGICDMTWFNQPFLKNRFKVGEKYNFFGKVKNRSGQMEMSSPVFDDSSSANNTGKIIPLYPTTYNLHQNTIRKIIENGVNKIKDEVEETLPEYVVEEYKLQSRKEAIINIHFPVNFAEYDKARRRLVFEELLIMQLALLSLKNANTNNFLGIEFQKNIEMSDVIDVLPYQLTTAQKRVLAEINMDMESQKPMNRLLQGDVGSR